MSDFSGFNPYQAPNHLEPEIHQSVGEPQRCPASAGWLWLAEAGRQYGQQPSRWLALAWLGMGAMFGCQLVLMLIPMIGGLIANLVSTLVMGGMLLASQELVEQRRFTPGLLLQGFREPYFARLLGVGGLYLAGSVAIMLLAMIIALVVFFIGGGSSLFSTDQPSTSEVLTHLTGPLLVAGGVALLLMLPLLMTYFYAPVLAVCGGLSATAAMKQSFIACARNWLALSIWSLLLLLLVLLTLLPVLLGSDGHPGFGLWLLWAVVSGSLLSPLTIASIYLSYRAIFLPTAHGK